MAEITGFTGKRRSPRIDMTAMVDVAFLLLTFFVLTAAMSSSKMMRLTMAPKGGEKTAMRADKIMTLRICANNEVEYFVGLDSLKKERVSCNKIRPAIQMHLNKFAQICDGTNQNDCWDPIFLIQPQTDSKYSTLVDVLDEMAISGAKKYAVDYD